jgi:hypothetical protein
VGDSRLIAKVPRPVSVFISLFQSVDFNFSILGHRWVVALVMDDSALLPHAPPVTIRSLLESILAAFRFMSKMSTEAFNLSACSTLGYRDESDSLVASHIDPCRAREVCRKTRPIRRHDSRPLCEARARLRSQGISKQDQPFS